MTLPWERLAQLRRQAGLTQVQLADGIVTQSMLCHIERGRTIPAPGTISALMGRLGVDVDVEVDTWTAWRDRSSIRDRLWISLILEDGARIDDLLQVGERLLVPFEAQAYHALRLTLAQDWAAAARTLAVASTIHPKLAFRGEQSRPKPVPSGRRSPRQRDQYAGAWTRIDKARACVAEAKANWHLCESTKDTVHAVYWKDRMVQFLWATIWKGA